VRQTAGTSYAAADTGHSFDEINIDDVSALLQKRFPAFFNSVAAYFFIAKRSSLSPVPQSSIAT
jgi:hypothetical protein